MLPHAVARVTLDQAAVGIGGDEPLPGCAQLGDPDAQPIDRFPQRLDMPVSGVIDLLCANPERLSVICGGGVKVAPSIPMRRGGSLPTYSPAGAVAPAAASS